MCVLTLEWFGQCTADDTPTDLNTIVFKLNLKCDFNPNAKAGAVNPEDLYRNSAGSSIAYSSVFM
jgi:hypothetical protein